MLKPLVEVRGVNLSMKPYILTSSLCR